MTASRRKEDHTKEYDPLDALLRPPLDESPEERALRIEREERAKAVSQAIDASIKAERLARRKKRLVRLLLLGQSESGKSTTLRQFQRLYTPTAFREERVLWRAVIQLNIVRSVRTILDALQSAPLPSASPGPGLYSHSPSHSHSHSHSHSRSPQRALPADEEIDSGPALQHPSPTRSYQPLSFAAQSLPPGLTPEGSPPPNYEDGLDEDGDYNGGLSFGSTGPSSSSTPHREIDQYAHSRHPSPTSRHHSPSFKHRRHGSNPLAGNPQLQELIKRLQPLRALETSLISALVPPDQDEAVSLPFPTGSATKPSPSAISASMDNSSNGSRNQEIFVRPGASWKGALKVRSSSSNSGRPSTAGSSRSTTEGVQQTADEAQKILDSARDDMMELWSEKGVRETLKRKKVRIEEGPGFFLEDLDRVTRMNFSPTDSDVLRARLKTVGVSEYAFEMEAAAGRDAGTEWRIIDVGGARNQRQTWVPFFDDVDAIIFLAPISAFDQVLTEDKTVNRLEDSVLLWKAVCQNKLLANVDLILFLNKCDILDAKLKAGVRLAKYVRSYEERENDIESVSKYLRGKFSAIHREYSPLPRKFYAFSTSVTDTTTTSGIIASIRDMVIRQHLKQSKLL